MRKTSVSSGPNPGRGLQSTGSSGISGLYFCSFETPKGRYFGGRRLRGFLIFLGGAGCRPGS